jgi:hypothetical protein
MGNGGIQHSGFGVMASLKQHCGKQSLSMPQWQTNTPSQLGSAYIIYGSHTTTQLFALSHHRRSPDTQMHFLGCGRRGEHHRSSDMHRDISRSSDPYNLL